MARRRDSSGSASGGSDLINDFFEESENELANVITGIRIVCALGLAFCPPFSIPFYVLYLICGVSDVLDGIVARCLGKETKSGAQLDTAADIVFTAVVILKTLPTVDIPTWVIVWTVCIAVLKAVNVITGFVMRRRFVAEHTVPNKICGVLLFALPLCVGFLPGRSVTVLIVMNCAVAAIAAVHEWYCIRTGKEIA